MGSALCLNVRIFQIKSDAIPIPRSRYKFWIKLSFVIQTQSSTVSIMTYLGLAILKVISKEYLEVKLKHGLT